MSFVSPNRNWAAYTQMHVQALSKASKLTVRLATPSLTHNRNNSILPQALPQPLEFYSTRPNIHATWEERTNLNSTSSSDSRSSISSQESEYPISSVYSSLAYSESGLILHPFPPDIPHSLEIMDGMFKNTTGSLPMFALVPFGRLITSITGNALFYFLYAIPLYGPCR
jgi:hypothetical protein